MRGLILAAGRGSRMGAMTEAMPKCMVPLSGRPLLDYQIEAMRRNGIDDILVIGGYQSEKLRRDDARLIRNADWESTNMVATLVCGREFLDEDFVLSYSDIVYRPGYVGALLAAPEDVALIVDRKWLDLWSLRFDDPYRDAETMVFDARGRIRELGKKITDPAKVQGQYTGLMKFAGQGRRRMLALLDTLSGAQGPAGFRKMYMTDFIQSLIDAGEPVQAVLVDGGWVEMDSDKDHALYASLAAQGRLKPFFDADEYGPEPA